MIDFRNVIQALIKERREQIAPLARHAGLSRSTLTEWLNGTRDNITTTSLAKLLAALGVDEWPAATKSSKQKTRPAGAERVK